MKKKKMLGILSLMLMLFGLFACSNEKIKEEDVVNLVEKYKKEQYTIKDPANPPTGSEIADKVEDYLASDVLEKQKANRTFQLAPDIAKKTNKSIELVDIVLEKDKENDDGTIDYKYTLKLKFDYGKVSEIIEKEGQLTISNDDGLKITRDWEEKIKIGNEVF